MSAIQSWERAIYNLSVQTPQPDNSKIQKERRENENSRRQKYEQHRPIKRIGPSLETQQSHSMLLIIIIYIL